MYGKITDDLNEFDPDIFASKRSRSKVTVLFPISLFLVFKYSPVYVFKSILLKCEWL